MLCRLLYLSLFFRQAFVQGPCTLHAFRMRRHKNGRQRVKEEVKNKTDGLKRRKKRGGGLRKQINKSKKKKKGYGGISYSCVH
ncbi:hypothetical protein V8C35DRAFT_304086, partial [Trichoderma chlorosporum]